MKTKLSRTTSKSPAKTSTERSKKYREKQRQLLQEQGLLKPKVPKTAAEYKRIQRERKRLKQGLLPATPKVPKTPAERKRKQRERQRLLLQEQGLSTIRVPKTAAERKQKQRERQRQLQEQEPETDQRLSKHAAPVAAKKSFTTVHNHGIQDDPEDVPTNFAVTSPKPAVTPHPYNRQEQPPKKINIIPCDVDLVMECDDESLSQLQVEILCDAQNDYNDMLRNFKELTACNVRIVSVECIEPVCTDVLLNIPTQNKSADVVKMPRNVKIATKSSAPAVMQMALSKATGYPSNTPIIIL